MKKILKGVWIIICCVIILVYLLSCFTPYIPPEKFSFTSLFAILFPYLFIVTSFCCITVFFIQKKVAMVLALVIILAGLKNIGNSVAFNVSKWNMPKSSNALRVMTWNCEDFINSFPQNLAQAEPRVKMLNALHLYSPDILCLQEFKDIENASFFISVKRELDSLGYIYSFISNDSVVHYKRAVVTTGSAIFSRIPLTDSGRINISNTELNENLLYGDIRLNNQPIRIFTAHLRSYSLYADTTNEPGNIYEMTYKRKHNVEYKIRETEIVHEKEVAIIRNVIAKSPYPVIYCGDINSTPASYTYNTLKTNLQDAFLEKGSGIGVTFYKLLYTLRIDVCLPDKKLKVLQCTVPQLYLSDHFPVVADVSWK